MNSKSIIIIGGGAAGIMTAIIAAKKGHDVTLLEQNSRIGKKILVSGNGKCNITNKNISNNNFLSSNEKFIEEFLDKYNFNTINNIFQEIGIEVIEGEEGKMYPMSLQASSVVKTLEFEAVKLGVNIICNSKVEAIKLDNQFLVSTNHDTFSSTHLVLALGSPASPQLGGNSLGYEFAKQLGHTTLPILPSLVQLTSSQNWVKKASGVKVKANVKLYTNGELSAQQNGDILFTNYGISGLAILDISSHVSTALDQYAYCELLIDLMPHINKEKLTNLLLKKLDQSSNKSIKLWLNSIMHEKIIDEVISQSNTKAKIQSELNRKEIGKLVYAIKNLKLEIDGTKGFEGAEVTLGGVNTTEVNPYTMESKIVKNLYIVGEMLDVTGQRGGYNFHFAWGSGLKAGLSF